MSGWNKPLPSVGDNLERFAASFDESRDFTVGVEEEFQLLDPETLELTHRFEDLKAALEPRMGAFARGELIASEIEVCTGQCNDMREAESDLLDKRIGLFEGAADLGITIGASGTHPFADWKDQRILDTPHYRKVEEQLRYCAWRNTTFGTHTHIGVRGHERVIAVYNTMRCYLPVLLALSANSPFAEGRYTYLHSTRTQLFTKFFPRCNIPGPFEGWDEYADYVETLFACGSIDDVTQIWWSIRPHPLFGTLEIRVCDCQGDIRDTLAISALIMALVAKTAADYDQGKAMCVLNSNQVEENFWRAIRYGLDGNLIDFEACREVPTRQVIESLLSATEPFHGHLGLDAHLDRIADTLSGGNGAQRQIRLYESSGDIHAVHREVVEWAQPRNWLPAGGDRE
ncbi:MAG TPA: YbdK family carboxylate-amine ligase [Actinobacteria bacterium]|nr:YbdK family carboxylate-amine ligase [Actinomycetota bacterium]